MLRDDIRRVRGWHIIPQALFGIFINTLVCCHVALDKKIDAAHPSAQEACSGSLSML